VFNCNGGDSKCIKSGKKAIADLINHWNNFEEETKKYKNLKGKEATVVVNGYKGKKEAIEAVEKSVLLYKEKFQ